MWGHTQLLVHGDFHAGVPTLTGLRVSSDHPCFDVVALLCSTCAEKLLLACSGTHVKLRWKVI